MDLSQCWEDSPFRRGLKQPGGKEVNLKEIYNERHRLALEELLSGGVQRFLDFLTKERLPNFLSDDEIQRIGSSAVAPPRFAHSHVGEETSLSGAADCSSVTYFPDVSDLEPPMLELGWPAFTAGSYRGVTRAVAYFQPSYGESIYSCKEAVRRMIQGAREVIAIVTDSLTDLEIFKDLQEASAQRRVPVYILLDLVSAPAFLKMCRNLGVRLDDLQHMRVRTITGTTYYTRSGARITGNVHERFMLIDGNKVATGSYRYDWTDSKLNSSNLVELSGQITEKFDEEFRVLYAQSVPINTHVPPVVGNACIPDQMIKPSVASSPSLTRVRPAPEPVCLTSTPNHKLQSVAERHTCESPAAALGEICLAPSLSTTGEKWSELQHMQGEEILAGCTAQPLPAEQLEEKQEAAAVAATTAACDAFTQTSRAVADGVTQTEHGAVKPPDIIVTESNTRADKTALASFVPSRHNMRTLPPPDNTLKDCFHKLARERQHYYCTIRSKLEHMVTTLSQRRELGDITNTAVGLGTHSSRQRVHKDWREEPTPRMLVEGVGTWPRSRCIH